MAKSKILFTNKGYSVDNKLPEVEEEKPKPFGHNDQGENKAK